MANVKKKTGNSDLSVEEKLKALYKLQTVDSKIDEIIVLRGELPLEVEDLEDEIAGLETRVNKYNDDIKELDESILNRKNKIKESEVLIAKYKKQQDNVRNNREYDSLSKEIEFQLLEIELNQKRIKESSEKITVKTVSINESKAILDDRKIDLDAKKQELDKIISGTQKDENSLLKTSNDIKKKIEPRLLNAYEKLRKNARNGLAVVAVQRDACGGCFNKIPPQRQLDVRTRKKIIVCEYCGRIFVDSDMKDEIK